MRPDLNALSSCGVLASDIEILLIDTLLHLRGKGQTFQIEFSSNAVAKRIGQQLSDGVDISLFYREPTLPSASAECIVTGLSDEGLVDLKEKPGSYFSCSNDVGSLNFNKVIVLGFSDLGISLIRNISICTKNLIAWDNRRVHRGDIGKFFRPEDLGMPRLKIAAARLAESLPSVRFISKSNKLKKNFQNANLIIVCVSRVDLGLVEWVSRHAKSTVIICEASRTGLHFYLQNRNPTTCLICVTSHRAVRDSFALSSSFRLARVELFEWRHTTEERLRNIAVGRSLELTRTAVDSGSAVAINLGTGESVAVGPHPLCIRCFPGEKDAIKQRRALELRWARELVKVEQPPNLDTLYKRLSNHIIAEQGFFSRVELLQLAGKSGQFWAKRGVTPSNCEVAMCQVAMALTPTGDRYGQRFVRGDGVHLSSPTGAKALAMLECVERAFTGCYTPELAYRKTRYSSIKLDSIDPTWMSAYSASQYRQPGFPCVPFSESLPLDWVWAMRLYDRRPVLIPVDFIRFSKQSPLILSTSNGAAVHSALTEAILHGVNEVIERDSLLLCWLNSISPPRIRDTTALVARVPLANALHRLGFDITLFDVTTELGVPVLMGLFRDSRNENLFSANTATGSSPEDALTQICREFVLQWRGYLNDVPGIVSDIASSFDTHRIRSLHDHLEFYQSSSKRPILGFLEASSEQRLANELPWQKLPQETRLPSMANNLHRMGIDIVVVDCTHPMVADLGLSAVKAILPHTQPLYAGISNAALGVQRLRRTRLDDPTPHSGSWSPNPWPHPYS